MVDHPKDWDWTGYQELTALRTRYCILATSRLLEHLGAGSYESFRTHYACCIDESITRDDMKRDEKWTESLAVGSESFVKKLGGHP